jgi:hypothetical protein
MPSPIPYNQALPSALTAATAPGFQVRTNQVVRLFFQLLGTPFATEADMKLKATWDALIAASDDTKVVYTPLFSNSKISMSAPLKTGKDGNETYRGIPEYFGEGVAEFTASFRGKDAASLNSLVALTQFSLMNSNGQSTLGVYMLNNDGMFMSPALNPVQIYNWSMRSRGSDGLNTNDIIDCSFDLSPNWDSDYVPLIPSFDPRNYI